MEMLTVFFILGGLIFYLILYRTELVPRYVSLWGIVAVLMLTAMNIMIYTGINIGALGAIFALPIIANEIFVAVWLMFRGVDTSDLSPP